MRTDGSDSGSVRTIRLHIWIGILLLSIIFSHNVPGSRSRERKSVLLLIMPTNGAQGYTFGCYSRCLGGLSWIVQARSYRQASAVLIVIDMNIFFLLNANQC